MCVDGSGNLTHHTIDIHYPTVSASPAPRGDAVPHEYSICHVMVVRQYLECTASTPCCDTMEEMGVVAPIYSMVSQHGVTAYRHERENPKSSGVLMTWVFSPHDGMR